MYDILNYRNLGSLPFHGLINVASKRWRVLKSTDPLQVWTHIPAVNLLRTNQAWLDELGGERGSAAQQQAHLDLANYLYVVAYNYTIFDHSCPPNHSVVTVIAPFVKFLTAKSTPPKSRVKWF